ncbi:hypothetical protein BC628DRAFT_441552 [Trametes gibbosa]|nr:hypothetical protein BC628DRAFT_441552 [Trametes gibbosa]
MVGRGWGWSWQEQVDFWRGVGEERLEGLDLGECGGEGGGECRLAEKRLGRGILYIGGGESALVPNESLRQIGKPASTGVCSASAVLPAPGPALLPGSICLFYQTRITWRALVLQKSWRSASARLCLPPGTLSAHAALAAGGQGVAYCGSPHGLSSH